MPPAMKVMKLSTKRANKFSQLSFDEMQLIGTTLRQERGSPADAWRAVTARRKTLKQKGPHKTSVYRYIHGMSHKRGQVETRGANAKLAKLDKRRSEQARRRLLKRADGGVPCDLRNGSRRGGAGQIFLPAHRGRCLA